MGRKKKPAKHQFHIGDQIINAQADSDLTGIVETIDLDFRLYTIRWTWLGYTWTHREDFMDLETRFKLDSYTTNKRLLKRAMGVDES